MAKNLICSVEGCDKICRTAGMCSKHYQRQRTGRPLDTPDRLFRGAREKFAETAALAATDECIEWPYSKFRDGYGRTRFRGVNTYAHRAVCTLAHGEMPVGMSDAAHSCNNRSCVNPRHLRWATHADNEGDKVVHGTLRFGEKVNFAKLTAADVIEIRRLLAERILVQSKIAERFGISQGGVSLIATGKRWARVH